MVVSKPAKNGAGQSEYIREYVSKILAYPKKMYDQKGHA